MKIAEWFLELFRKKEFYQVDIEKLKKEFSITFKEVSDDDLLEIKKVIIHFEDAKSTEDFKAQLYTKDSVFHENIDDLILEINQIIKVDYKETYFKSKEEGWDFQYFLNSSGGAYGNTLFISNSMTYPNDKNYGNVIYHLLAVKKKSGKYYLWDLLEKED